MTAVLLRRKEEEGSNQSKIITLKRGTWTLSCLELPFPLRGSMYLLLVNLKSETVPLTVD